MKPTLLVLAAGKGSRFGGAKQFEPMGPHGESMLDYSVFDAVRAGFARVVFVVAPEALPTFMPQAMRRYGDHIAVDCVAQDLHDCPPGFVVAPARVRPWGTLHAVLAARHAIDKPFGVVNADDFYGRDAFVQLARFLAEPQPVEGSLQQASTYCMVAYALARTLSPHGGVNRGICVAQDGLLRRVEEHTGIVLQADGRCVGTNAAGAQVPLSGGAWVSMNIWGFMPSAWASMQAAFQDFLQVQGTSLSAECYLPAWVDSVVDAGSGRCRVLHTTASWCGMTYREDKAHCVQAIAALVGDSTYPARLWEVA